MLFWFSYYAYINKKRTKKYLLFSFYYLNSKAKNKSNFLLEIVLKIKNLTNNHFFLIDDDIITSKKKPIIEKPIKYL